MAKKYLQNEKGIVKAITSENLQLEKPLLNENYDINVHNRNMDKIDSAIQRVEVKIDGLELVASNVKMNDGSTVEKTVSTNKMNITSLQSGVSSNSTNITSLQSKVSSNSASIASLQSKVSSNSASIASLQDELGTNKTTLQNNINIIREVL